MRVVGYLAQQKASLLTQTIFQVALDATIRRVLDGEPP